MVLIVCLCLFVFIAIAVWHFWGAGYMFNKKYRKLTIDSFRAETEAAYKEHNSYKMMNVLLKYRTFIADNRDEVAIVLDEVCAKYGKL